MPKEAQNQNKDLAVLLPDREIQVAGQSITVYPFRFVDLPKVLHLVGKYRAILGELDLVSAILSHGEDGLQDLVILACLSSSLEPDFFESPDLQTQDALEIFAEVLEVNASFFVQQIQSKSQRIAAALKETGATSSAS
jgi:hypothetical protein